MMRPIASLFIVSIALGQDSSRIITDRPSTTNTPETVPKGMVQVENGVRVTADQGQRTLTFPETLVRIGVLSSTELRLTAPAYSHDAVTASGVRSGFSDFALGVQQRLYKSEAFAVAVILTLSPPTGSAAISGPHREGSVQIPWSVELSKKWMIGGMLSVYSRLSNGLFKTTGQSSFVVDRKTGSWDFFGEYVGNFPAAGSPLHLVRAGAMYDITPNQQLDFAIAVGLSVAALNHSVSFGYSFRFR
jgi:Putative MetA-pathway of phenol degradation